MVPCLNDSGLELINERFEAFAKILDMKSKMADMTWQNVFSSFIFDDEKSAIEQHVST